MNESRRACSSQEEEWAFTSIRFPRKRIRKNHTRSSLEYSLVFASSSHSLLLRVSLFTRFPSFSFTKKFQVKRIKEEDFYGA